MAKSFYKAPWIGKLPMCAICGGAGEGPRAEHHLTHGVSVWLCGAHRSDEFQRRRGGRDFVASLHAVWRAGGLLTKRHAAALTHHLRRVRPPQPQRDLPGSYAWPALRAEAERRYAAGESPRTVIPDLRARYADLPVNTPTLRTMRRWFTDGRWLADAPAAPTGDVASTARNQRVGRSSGDPARTAASPTGNPVTGARSGSARGP